LSAQRDTWRAEINALEEELLTLWDTDVVAANHTIPEWQEL
jgi:hypothetical protein